MEKVQGRETILSQIFCYDLGPFPKFVGRTHIVGHAYLSLPLSVSKRPHDFIVDWCIPKISQELKSAPRSAKFTFAS